METLRRAEHHPAIEGVGRREGISWATTAMGGTARDPAGFGTELRPAQFGAIEVLALTIAPSGPRRTPEPIRRPEPGTFHLIVAQRGRAVMTQEGRETALRPAELVLIDNSRPYQVRALLDDEAFRGILVAFARPLLPLPAHRMGRSAAVTLSGHIGIGALFTQYLTRLTTDTDDYHGRDAARLGAILLDLLAALLTRHLDTAAGTDAATPPRTHQHTLLQRIHAYIHQHLTDPGLSPATIAGAHNISIRTLHRLFHSHHTTIAAWIRAQRLDHIRRDLTDPALSHRPIHAIAARWGFTDPAHFSRTFRAATGLTPDNYRRQHQQTARPSARPTSTI